MYLRYFGFSDHPFSVTPDPAFLYLSAHHREALGHLLYGTGEHGGFVQLTGEVGTGKTTLIRALLEQDQPELDIALCLNPHQSVTEFIASICDDLGVAYPKRRKLTTKELVDRLNKHLLQTHGEGRRTVLIIDEAQNLSREVLEQVRLLTNLETHKHKLLRIILVGQPELETMLRRADMRQLAQRITARYHLPPLSREETRRYIHHRLERVGGSALLFTPAACRAVHRRARGTPRLINSVCERALMGAYSRGAQRIDWRLVQRAAFETLPRRWRPDYTAIGRQLVPVAVLAAAALLAFGLHYSVLSPADAAGEGLQAASDSAPAAGEGDKIAGSPAPVAAEGQDDPPAQAGDESQKTVAAPEQQQASLTRTAAAEESAGSGKPADDSPATSRQNAQADGAQSAQSVVFPQGNAGMGQLLRLWGVFGAGDGARCATLSIGDLRCLGGRGSFADLERYGLPALLVLQHGQQRRRVLLAGLDNNNATLVLSSGTRQWPRAALARYWTGEYQIIWRRQASTSLIRPGSVGDSVIWLRRRLALAAGVNLDARAASPSPMFDDALETRLRRFQITHGLTPDGIVGPRTMIVLDSIAPQPSTPRLQPKESG